MGYVVLCGFLWDTPWCSVNTASRYSACASAQTSRMLSSRPPRPIGNGLPNIDLRSQRTSWKPGPPPGSPPPPLRLQTVTLCILREQRETLLGRRNLLRNWMILSLLCISTNIVWLYNMVKCDVISLVATSLGLVARHLKSDFIWHLLHKGTRATIDFKLDQQHFYTSIQGSLDLAFYQAFYRFVAQSAAPTRKFLLRYSNPQPQPMWKSSSMFWMTVFSFTFKLA